MSIIAHYDTVRYKSTCSTVYLRTKKRKKRTAATMINTLTTIPTATCAPMLSPPPSSSPELFVVELSLVLADGDFDVSPPAVDGFVVITVVDEAVTVGLPVTVLPVVGELSLGIVVFVLFNDDDDELAATVD